MVWILLLLILGAFVLFALGGIVLSFAEGEGDDGKNDGQDDVRLTHCWSDDARPGGLGLDNATRSEKGITFSGSVANSKACKINLQTIRKTRVSRLGFKQPTCKIVLPESDS